MRHACGVMIAVLALTSCGGTAPAPAQRRRAAASPEQARMDDLLRQNEPRASEPTLAEAYDSINARYFENRLLPVRIRWEEELDTIGGLIADGFRLEGLTNGKVILLHPALERDERQLQAVLCHEMVHVALRDGTDAHGPEFQSRLRALAEQGAFEGIVASEEEKEQLKEQLEKRSRRLSSEFADLRQARSRIEADAPALPSETLQDRTWAFNTRVRRHNEDLEEYNRLVAQYNLMTSYPDGLDRERLAQRSGVSVVPGGER